MRICAVKNCHNGEYKLQKFRKSNPGQLDPFALYTFPRKSEQQRHDWCVLINRKDELGNLWTPKQHSRVCSLHFKDGQPTEQNPNPTLHLGYKCTKTYSSRGTENSGFDRTAGKRKEQKIYSTNVKQQNSSYSHPCRQTSLDITEQNETLLANTKKSPRLSNIGPKVTRKSSGFSKFKQKAGVRKIKVFKTFTTTDERTKFYTGIPTRSLYFSLAR